MTDHVYKHIELTGTSKSSIEDAAASALQRAQKTINNVRWFEVVDIRGNIDGHQAVQWQVRLKVGFTVEE